MHTQITDNRATVYSTVQLRTHTFKQENALKNHVTTTAYHDIVTTLYPLLYPDGGEHQITEDIFYIA